MKISAALLCSISVAAFAGSVPACDSHTSADQVAISAQDTTARPRRSDTTARTPAQPKHRAPKRTPRYCPACGMG